MTPVKLDILMPTLTSIGLGCHSCSLLLAESGLRGSHSASCCDEFPEDWKADQQRLSVWIGKMSSLYKHRVKITVIDAHSPLGIWKKIRFRLDRTPAFIVDEKRTYAGWDTEQLEAIIDERIREESERLKSGASSAGV